MRVIIKCFVASVMMVLLIFLVGCQSNSTHSQNNNATMPNLVITNYSDEYEFIAFLNDEPIFSARNSVFCNWKGFPLNKGENELRIVFSQNNKVNAFEIESWLDVAILYGAEYKYEYLRDKIKKGEQFERTVLFKYKNIEINNEPYNLLSTMKQSKILRDIEKLTLYLIQLYAARDYSTLVSKMALKGEKEILFNYPKWLLTEEGKNLRINHISSTDDFDLIIGKRLILVKPSKFFVKKTGSEALCTIEKMRSNEGGSFRLSLPCFVFAMQNNTWCLLENGTPFPIKDNN